MARNHREPRLYRRNNAVARIRKQEEAAEAQRQEASLRDAMRKKRPRTNISRGVPLFLRDLLRRSRTKKMLEEYGRVLPEFAPLEKYLIRTPDTWKPRGKASRTVWRSLLRHLFVQYPIPEEWLDLFERTLPEKEDEMESWKRETVIRVAQGHSLFKIFQEEGALPVQMTRKMCQEALRTTSLDFVASLRKAQVVVYGGSPALVKAVIHGPASLSQISYNKHQEVFNHAVIQWFAGQRMLDAAQIGPMYDYLNNRRLEVVREGKSFTFKGRTALTVLRDMEAWHAELQKVPARKMDFKPSGFKWWSSLVLVDPRASLPKLREMHRAVESLPEVAAKFEAIVEAVNYGNPLTLEQTRLIQEYRPDIEIDAIEVSEVLSSEELHSEGKALHHCVYSYSRSIETGNTSIWSFRRDGERTLTIEVRNMTGKIVQVRGLLNREATPVEIRAVRQWATYADLSVSSDIR